MAVARGRLRARMKGAEPRPRLAVRIERKLGRKGSPPPALALTGMLYRVRYRVLMATLVPQRQHSFMSPATWQPRQG